MFSLMGYRQGSIEGRFYGGHVRMTVKFKAETEQTAFEGFIETQTDFLKKMSDVSKGKPKGTIVKVYDKENHLIAMKGVARRSN